ncbi:hypothetical protein A2332_01130 [Candidatus Uhrbacteria bacterium RIFOXYB2_FULL_41_18]|nr:MAG: hypothetical protein UT94_C0047G0006 [Candidatus Uhrbacteria bacterium GW2011_GWF2_40_263]OGL97306.1 MAG: hypothetical protein A2332_01130 [Candidatus Uhrbacteria bacterium RIFOXYB2_FULL_41_18]
MFRRYAYAFPIILIVLTILLIVFMVKTLISDVPSEVQESEDIPVVVTSEGYQTSVSEILSSFSFAFGEAQTELEKGVLVDNALNDVLTLRVPSDFQQAHLDLVFGLNALREVLQGEGDLTSALERINLLSNTYPWMGITHLSSLTSFQEVIIE